mmetsp:Transcript_20211/g.56189  ORF Transcript_20211/g.56189 Transcript_20211/m.56189 type:complete len:118 (-) Transcript_20211:210-563(-)
MTTGRTKTTTMTVTTTIRTCDETMTWYDGWVDGWTDGRMDASPVLRCIVSRPVASLPWNDFPFGPGAKEARPRKRVLVLDRVKAAKNSSPRAQYCASGRYVVDQVQRNLTTGAQHPV